MRHARIIGIALVAAFALSAAAAASASAHTFNSTVTGKLKVVSNSQQVFSTNTIPKTEVICQKVTAETGEAKAGEQAEIKSKVNYTECTLAVGGVSLGAATVEKTNYNFHAEGEAVDSLEEAVIKAVGCTVKVPAQNGLKKVTYVNEGNDVNVHANVTNINWTQKGASCETPTAGNEASYTGTALIEVIGGAISWK